MLVVASLKLHHSREENYTVYHLKVEVSCVVFVIQPVCPVPNQNTRNLYLQADDKRCTSRGKVHNAEWCVYLLEERIRRLRSHKGDTAYDVMSWFSLKKTTIHSFVGCILL